MRLLKTTEHGECDGWLEEIGMVNAYNGDGTPFWSPEYSIEFSQAEADSLMQAAESVYAHMRRTFERRRWDRGFYASLGLAREDAAQIERSWARGDPSFIGRLDLGLNDQGDVRLYEYNCDPLGLQMASSLAQEAWFAYVAGRGRLSPHSTQYAEFRPELACALAAAAEPGLPLHIVTVADDASTRANTQALAACIQLAGREPQYCALEGIGINAEGWCVDAEGSIIEQAIKLAKWQSVKKLQRDCRHPTAWMDPPWTEVFGNKAFMHYLWSEEPQHPNLLPTYLGHAPPQQDHPCGLVYKPIGAVQGLGVRVLAPGEHAYAQAQAGIGIWQNYFESRLDGFALTVSVWIIGGKAVRSLAVRAQPSAIVDGQAVYLPHTIARGA